MINDTTQVADPAASPRGLHPHPNGRNLEDLGGGSPAPGLSAVSNWEGAVINVYRIETRRPSDTNESLADSKEAGKVNFY